MTDRQLAPHRLQHDNVTTTTHDNTNQMMNMNEHSTQPTATQPNSTRASSTHETSGQVTESVEARLERLRARRGQTPRSTQAEPTGSSRPSTCAGHRSDGIDAATPDRRPSPRATNSGKRQHAAAGGRVVAAGFGVAAMLGLVGLMGLHQAASTVAVPAVAPAPVVPVVPVVPVAQNAVLIGTLGNPNVVVATPASLTNQTSTAQQTSAGAIALTARPVVSQAAPSAAPRATSNGSR